MKEHYKFILNYDIDVPDNLTDEEETAFVVDHIYNDIDTGNYKTKVPIPNSPIRLLKTERTKIYEP